MARELRETLPSDVQLIAAELLELSSRSGSTESKIAASVGLIGIASQSHPGSTVAELVSDVQALLSRAIGDFDNEHDRQLLVAGLNLKRALPETSARKRILSVWVTWKISSPGYLTDDGALERFRNVLLHRLAWKLTGRRTWSPALTDLDLAKRYENQGRFEESEKLLAGVVSDLQIAPSDRVAAFMVLSSVHTSKLELELAAKDIEESLPLTNALQEDTATIELIPQIDRLAGRMTQEEEYDQALRLAKTALVYLPSSGRLWRRLGCVQWYAGNFVDALAAFDAALVNGEDRGHVLHERGQVLAEMGQYQRAIEDLTEALSQPRSTESQAGALSARAYAIAMSGNLDEALKDFSQAEILNPGSGWLFYFRGLCYLKYEMKEDAGNDLRSSLSKNLPRLTKAMRLRVKTTLKSIENQL